MGSHTADEVTVQEDLGRCHLDNSLGDNMLVPKATFTRWGDLWVPETLTQLMLVLESEVRVRNNNIVGWRGQSDISWKIHSGAARRLTQFGATTGNLEDDVTFYEDRLLNDARLSGRDVIAGRDLPSLELLSVLQHYGAATRLLDFTRNALVALWFAAAELPKRYGLLIGVEGPRAHHARSVDTRKEVAELVAEREKQDQYVVWEPRHLFERMRVQQSTFIFGKAEENEWGSAPFTLPGPRGSGKRGELLLIAISPKFKGTVYELNRSAVFGYSGKTMYPDLEGFGRSHSATSGFEDEFFQISGRRVP